jgi:hypothetical protein
MSRATQRVRKLSPNNPSREALREAEIPRVVSLENEVSLANEPVAADARMIAGRAVQMDGARAVIELSSKRRINADIDESVHPSVIATAVARGERVLVEIANGRALIVGALRTQPTPGIERAERYEIDATSVAIGAAKVSIEGEEVVLSSHTARIVLRAASEIESFAERIVSRAEGVHKIVGRMLRLN